MIMPRIKMLEKMSTYKVTYMADRPGEIGAKFYAKKVFAGNESDAVIAFNNWFDSCNAFPEGSSCDIQKVELIQSEGANKSYTFTWWDNEPAADRRPTTKADLKNCLHKEIFLAADDAEALKLAVEYLCDYIGDDPKNVADTPEEIWDYFNGDWGAGNPIPMVLKQRSRVVKDSGFDPKGEGDGDDWDKAVEKELVKKYNFSPGWAELCVDGNWKGLVSKYLNDGKSPEECAKAINDTGANK
jgi:hypothetical protein